MGTSQIIAATNKLIEIKYNIFSKDQIQNTPKSIEAIVLLNIVMATSKKSKYITRGSLITCINNRDINRINNNNIITLNFLA